MVYIKTSHLDGVQGVDEQLTELYIYGTAKEAAQSTTQQSGKSCGSAVGSADRQVAAMGEF